MNVHWKDWCWSWNSNTLATWCEELTHLKRPWCWQRLKAGGEWDDKGWGSSMASLTQWTWVWASSGSWWWTGRPGVLQSMGSQKVGHHWATGLTELSCLIFSVKFLTGKNLFLHSFVLFFKFIEISVYPMDKEEIYHLFADVPQPKDHQKHMCHWTKLNCKEWECPWQPWSISARQFTKDTF